MNDFDTYMAGTWPTSNALMGDTITHEKSGRKATAVIDPLSIQSQAHAGGQAGNVTMRLLFSPDEFAKLGASYPDVLLVRGSRARFATPQVAGSYIALLCGPVNPGAGSGVSRI